MDGSQKIEQLKKEVEHLSEQVSVNHQRLEKLEQQLRRLMEEKTITTDASSQKLLKQTPTNENLNFENFIGLRLIHLVGIVVLVIGLSIGVKYAIDRELVSEVTRIVSAYGAGFLLYFFSWRLKKNYNLFSAILFSGAMASIYFTTYAAFVYYGMFSFAVAFVIMIALTLFTVYKALEYKRQEIAILGLVGAYTIPFLISTNADRADLLFAYIGLINIGVVFLAFKKSWNLVGQLAQAVTWILFLGWIGTRYNVQDQKTAFVFMIFFFLLFAASALSNKLLRSTLFTLTQVQQLLLNNVALYIAAVFIAAHAFYSVPFGSVTGFFAVFVSMQTFLYHYFAREEKYAKTTHATLALFLLIIFIAFKWEGVTVTLLWLLTAVILFGSGVYFKSISLRMSAIVLMGITLLKLVILDSRNFTTVQKIIAYITLGALLLIVSFFYQKFKERLFSKE